jgi:hypothetical protein
MIGDMAVHGEEAYPVEEEDEGVPAMVGAGTPDGGPGMPDDPFVTTEVASD